MEEDDRMGNEKRTQKKEKSKAREQASPNDSLTTTESSRSSNLNQFFSSIRLDAVFFIAVFAIVSVVS